jgi:hypothetical protein
LVSKNPIVKKIAEGSAKEDILELLVEKHLPFTEEEYLESLVFALKHESFKTQIREALEKIPESTKAGYVEKREANHRVAYFVILEALNLSKETIIARAIHNQALPYEFLAKIAERGTTSMMEMVLDNQIKMIAYPEIMEAMEKNPDITNFIRGKIKSLRDYYMLHNEAEEIPAEEVMEDIIETFSQEEENTGETEETGESEETEVEEEEEDLDILEGMEEVEERAMTALQEINAMSIAERVKLALTGTKTHRMILIKDSNKMVALAVMESPKITIDEISVLAKNKSLPIEIVGRISRNREWTKNYPVMLELIQNPKTPVKDAMSFLKKLHIRDLRQITHNKNINPVIRTMAVNFHNQKSGVRK